MDTPNAAPAPATPDFEAMSTPDLDAWIASHRPVSAATDDKPKLPPLPLHEVVQGTTESEQAKAANDGAFASYLVTRHRGYLARTAAGEDPTDPNVAPDLEFYRWRQRMEEKPGFWSSLASGAYGMGKGILATAQESDEIAMQGASGDLTDASKRVTDLAVVSGAKALAFNSALVRDAGRWTDSAITKVQKLFADAESRDQLDLRHSAYSFEVARANRADADTAENFHKTAAQLAPVLAGIVGDSNVNQEAADTLSLLPQLATEAGLARAASRAGFGAASGAYLQAVEKLGTQRSALAGARALLDEAASKAMAGAAGSADVLRDAQTAVKTLQTDVSAREAAIGAVQQAAKVEAAQLTKVSAARSAAGAAVTGVGKAINRVGDLLETVQNAPGRLAARIAPESEKVQDAIASTIRTGAAAGIGAAVDDDSGRGLVVGGLLGYGGGRLVSHFAQAAGEDVARLGEVFSQGQATIPFFQRVRKTRDISGITQQLAGFLDNSVLAAGTKLGVGAAKGATAAGAFGAGLGAFSNPDNPVGGAGAGAGSGAVFGLGVGALSQWRTYADAGVVRVERAGQLRAYRDLLAARPDELKVFNTLPEETQQTVAHYLGALPDLKINWLNDPKATPGNYDGRALPDTITINVAAKDPLKDIVAHEIAHYAAEHQLGDFITRSAIGDAEASIPGEYTARDANGAPIVVTDANGRKSYQTNAEFNALRDKYVAAIKTTGARAGWSADRILSETDRVSSPAYIASEIFAEQHVQYLNSDEFTRDVKGFAPNDVVMNSAFLKNALGRLGVNFKPSGEIVESTLLGTYKKSKAFDSLMREYYRRQSVAKFGDTEFVGGETRIDQSALTKATGYAEKYLTATGELLRDTAGNPIYGPDGKAILRKASDVTKDVKAATQAAVEAINERAKSTSTPVDPNEVQPRTSVDGKTLIAGRYFADDVVDAVEKSGKFNPVQMANLRQINGELKAGFGREWSSFYQAATKKGSGSVYRSLAGRFRTDLAYGFLVSAADNILVQSVSLEVLGDNAARAVAKGDANLWNNNLGDLLKDTRTYLGNLTNGLPGDTGVGAEKKNFINNLLGIRVKAHGDVNPLHEVTNAPKTAITSLRLDRMNRVSPVSERNVPFSAESYDRVVKNLRPEADGNTTSEGSNTPADSRSADENGKDLEVKNSTSPHRQAAEEDTANFRPEANEETQRVAAAYVRKHFGDEYTPHSTYDELPEAKLRRIADYFETEAQHTPNDPAVRASYSALARETLDQYRAMEAAGIKIEPWTNTKGEPYASSADMVKDVRDHKHLWFFPTASGFGSGVKPDQLHPLMAPSGVEINGHHLLDNDLFRAVHDYFGHTQQGFQFGPRGEFNAWRSHATMFSDTAQGALAAETLAQNAWVNFGAHLRDAAGKIATKGESGYVAPKDRPFADQRAFVLPDELRQSVSSDLPAGDTGANGAANDRGLGSYRPQAGGDMDSGEIQLAGKRLPDALKDRKLELVHFSGAQGLKEIDPQFLGKGHATPNDRRGLNASFFYVKGSPMGGDAGMVDGVGKTRYSVSVSGARIYNANTDALGYWDVVNREKGDRMLVDKGYAGLAVETSDDRQIVKLFESVRPSQ